jgi:hypothetical protein
MAKKREVKQTQLLSPEKYIRQKSRTLPIYKCWINDDWEESKMANVIVSRQHANGRISACIYLTDTGCLGVKDTFYMFNIPAERLKEVQDGYPVRLLEIPYDMAHNVIFEAIKYAARYGFAPHQTFTQTTSFFLEDKDDPKIPLMDIPCGDEKGNPIYVNTGYETPARANEIRAQLERAKAGEVDFPFYHDDDVDVDVDEEEDKELTKLIFKTLTFEQEERYSAFINILTRQLEGNPEKYDGEMLSVLSDLIVLEIVDEKQIQKELENIKKEISHPIVEPEELPNSQFAGVQDYYAIAIPYAEALYMVTNDHGETKKQVETKIEQLREQLGEGAVVDYLHLMFLESRESRQYEATLKKYHDKYPDYFLITLKWYFNRFDKRVINKADVKAFHSILSTLKLPITQYEFKAFFMIYAAICLKFDKLSLDEFAKILALERYVQDEDLKVTDTYCDYLIEAIEPIKALQAVMYLSKKGLL